MLYVLLPTLAVVVVALFLLLGPFAGVPAILIALAVVAGTLLSRGRSVTVERSNPEPTGTVRSASGGAETANDRVGQS
jgi:hypothetical protein